MGLTLAIDLGRRGVRCTLIERNAASIQLPKMERCNARTMEIYRRLGISERVRDAGLPRTAPMDVFLALSMASPALVQLRCPSVAEATREIAAHNDGGLLEPYQLISQYTLEPLLRSIVETIPIVSVRFACELISFTQGPDSVTAVVQPDRRGGGNDSRLVSGGLRWRLQHGPQATGYLLARGGQHPQVAPSPFPL